MRRNLAIAAFCAALAAGSAANAAVLSFDLGGLIDPFTGTSVSGGFDFDTADRSFDDIAIDGIIADYGPGSGTFLPEFAVAGFGFNGPLFQFAFDTTTLQFSIDGFDVDTPNLASGESTVFDDVIAQEGETNDDFQLTDPFAGALLFGSVAITQVDAPAPIPLPASLPLLVAGLAGLGLLRRKRLASV